MDVQVNVGGMQHGGLVMSPALRMLAEAGPEWVIPVSQTAAFVRRMALNGGANGPDPQMEEQNALLRQQNAKLDEQNHLLRQLASRRQPAGNVTT